MATSACVKRLAWWRSLAGESSSGPAVNSSVSRFGFGGSGIRRSCGRCGTRWRQVHRRELRPQAMSATRAKASSAYRPPRFECDLYDAKAGILAPARYAGAPHGSQSRREHHCTALAQSQNDSHAQRIKKDRFIAAGVASAAEARMTPECRACRESSVLMSNAAVVQERDRLLRAYAEPRWVSCPNENCPNCLRDDHDAPDAYSTSEWPASSPTISTAASRWKDSFRLEYRSAPPIRLLDPATAGTEQPADP